MATVSFRRLSDETLRKYEQLEREGKLTPRQQKALKGHRMLAPAVEAMCITRVSEEAPMSDDIKYNYYGKPPAEWPDDAKREWDKVQERAKKERATAKEDADFQIHDIHRELRFRLEKIEKGLRKEIDDIGRRAAKALAKKDEDDE